MMFNSSDARHQSKKTWLKHEREERLRQRAIEHKLAPLLKKALDRCLIEIKEKSGVSSLNNLRFSLDSSWHSHWTEEDHPFHRLNLEEQPIAAAWLIRQLEKRGFRVKEKHDFSDSDFGSSFSWYLDIWW